MHAQPTFQSMVLSGYSHLFHDLKYEDDDSLFHGALLNALLCDQSHNFIDLLIGLRNVLRNCSKVFCCIRQHHLLRRFPPNLGTSTSTGIVRTASTNLAMTCGNIFPRLRPRLAVWTQPPKITILRTSVNSSPDVPSSSVFHHSRTRTFLTAFTGSFTCNINS